MIIRTAAVMLAVAATALTTGCVIAPNSSETNAAQRAEDVRKMSEQATTTCGAGFVKEVNAKSFTCK